MLLHAVGAAAVPYVSYAVVVTAFLLSLTVGGGKIARVTQGALLLTLAADAVLVLCLSPSLAVGMLFFSVVQLLYAVRLVWQTPPRHRGWLLALRGAVSLLALLATTVVLGEGCDLLALLSLFYFSNLLVNAATALALARRGPFLAMGLSLFVFCDLFVGFSMLGQYLPSESLPAFLTHPPINMAWVFYAPSQLLLAISPLDLRLRRKKEQE